MFWTRLFSGIVLVAIAFVTLFTGGYLLAAVCLAISLAAYRELVKACGICSAAAGCGDAGSGRGSGKINALEGAGYLATFCYYAAVVFTEDAAMQLFVVLFALMAFMFVYVFTFPRFRAEQVMGSFFCFVYAPVMFAFIYRTRELGYGIYLVWMILISSWMCDTCAYAVGMLFGKHKLTPRLSPKKSIEGAIGGVAGSALAGGLYGHFLVEKVVAGQEVTWIFVLLSAAGAVISQVGDLAASAIKRNHGIKDYGHLIPGHGGIMDRFDSVIFTAPIIYALAVLLLSR